MPQEEDASPPPNQETLMMTPPTSGGSILPSTGVPLREVIGDFEVLDRLGAGGMGAVYRARQVSLGRMVALKILPGQFIESSESVERFQREARVAASLNHAHLVKVYAAGEAAGCHYIAMELIEGEDLGVRLKREGKLLPTEALRICADVARALEHGWQRAQLVHRDIKPGNIFLTATGVVKVGDLGLAKSLLGNTTGLTQTGTMMGTPHYMSPEQARGDKELDFRADIYSLGCTLFQMLTGQVPYRGTDAITVIRQHLDAPLPAILKVWPQCPVPLARLVGRMLKKARHERFASYEELIAQIESVWSQIDPVGFNPEAFAPPKRNVEVPPAEAPAAPEAASEERRFATAGKDGGAGRSAVKNRRSLVIAAGLLVLGVGAWLAWPKEEKLTKAQLYMKEHGAELNASATPAPAPAPSPRSEPTAIKLWDSPEKISAGKGVRWEDGAVVLGDETFRIELQDESRPSRDAILRARIRMNVRSGSHLPQLALRRTPDGGYFVLSVAAERQQVTITKYDGQKNVQLKGWRLPRSYGPDEWPLVEFRATGDELTALVDGEVVGTVRDTSLPGPGGVMLSGQNASFRDIEYVPLDRVVAPATAATERWQDALGDPDTAKKFQRTSAGWTLNGNAMLGELLHHDGAIRYRAAFTGRLGKLKISPRRSPGNAESYQGYVDEDGAKAMLQRVTGTSYQVPDGFRQTPLATPVKEGQMCEVELRLVGSTMTMKINGQVVIQGEAPGLVAGPWTLACYNGASPPIQSLEYLNLDASAGASAAPAEPWQDMLHDPAKLKLDGAVERRPEGLRFPEASGAKTLGPQRDGAVRMRATFGGVRVRLQVRETPSGQYQLYVGDEKKINLGRWDRAARQFTLLRDFPLQQPLLPGQDYDLELRVVGQTLTAKLNGEVLGTATDGTFSEGRFGVAVTDHNAVPTLVKTLEVLDLDAPGGASATPAAEPWQDMLHATEKLTKNGKLETTPDGVSYSGSASLAKMRDGAVRMRAVVGGTGNGSMQLMVRNDAARGGYTMHVWTHKVRLERYVASKPQPDMQHDYTTDPKLEAGQEYEAELRAVGDRITATFNGKVVATLTDSTFAEGSVGLMSEDRSKPTLIKSLEVLDLDAPGGVSAATASAEAWQDVRHDPAKLYGTEKAQRAAEGLRLPPGGYVGVRNSPTTDGAIRMRAGFGLVHLAVVARASESGNYQLRVGTEKPVLVLIFWTKSSGRGVEKKLGEFPLPKPLALDEEYEIELRVVGPTITAKFNGAILGTVVDQTLVKGEFAVRTDSANPEAQPPLIKSLEVLDLTAPTVAAAASVPGEEFTFGGHRYRLLPDKLSWKEAKARAEALGGHLATITSKEENDWIRATFIEKLPVGVGVWLGGTDEGAPGNWRWITGEPFTFTDWIPGEPSNGPGEPALNFSEKGWGDISDSGIGNQDRRGGLLVEWEAMNEESKVATKDRGGGGDSRGMVDGRAAPFENSLGMKFVPVPITGGPTGGQRVLFSVWDTRVQDYRIFATETKREWTLPDFEQGPTHPAVQVSWDDATAFCAWLTERERKTVQLSANERYRLPSDHEWSCAVGLGGREDAAKLPADKNGKLDDTFPWGTQWPPPEKAGNFASEELTPLLAAGKHSYNKGVIPGYYDGYAETSPVASFAANPFGLFDMSGNVWQWCEDWFDKEQKERIMRGASWRANNREFVLPSCRYRKGPAIHDPNIGFRVILAPAPTP